MLHTRKPNGCESHAIVSNMDDFLSDLYVEADHKTLIKEKAHESWQDLGKGNEVFLLKWQECGIKFELFVWESED